MGTLPGEPDRAIEPEAPARSQLISPSSRGKQPASWTHFIPFIILVLTVFLANNPTLWLVGLAVAGATYAAIYYLCGKTKPVWLPLVPATITFLLLSPHIWPVFDSVFGLLLDLRADLAKLMSP